MFRMLRSRRGNAFVEALFVLPVYIFFIVAILESGFLVYNWAVVNYATSSAAVKAAVQGQFTPAIRQEAADYLRDWTLDGKTMNGDYMALSPRVEGNTIVVWGTDPNQRVHRGGNVVVGIVYPVRFKLLSVGGLGSWLVQQYDLTLKTRAVVMSERYFE